MDNEEMSCQEHWNGKGQAEKICLPQKPVILCNEDNGGKLTYTGFVDGNVKSWECLCSFPQYYGSKGCGTLNPNVCKGGKFTYDSKNMQRPPTYEDCKCPHTHERLVNIYTMIPTCVPKKETFCKNKTMCEAMYQNSVVI
jgi:hypothetical protein